MPSPNLTHLARPDRDRAFCLDCGRPVRRGTLDSPSDWVHAPLPYRQPDVPTHEQAALKALEDWLAADRDMLEAQARRDQAFRRMVKAGMIGYQIARAIGVEATTVIRWAKQLGLELRRPDKAPPNRRQVLAARRKRFGV